jgi:hypothetical protein
MKKVLKIVGILVLLIIAFVLIAGLFVSKDYHFQKDMVINAPQEKVWSHINSLREMEKWSPWSSRDPNIQITYEGQDGTVGSKYHWKGNKEVGSGNMTITGIDPLKETKTQIHFIEPWEGDANSFIRLADQGGSTKVTWGFDSKTPYPMNVMHLFMNMDAMMDQDFSTGLTKLKSLSESN